MEEQKLTQGWAEGGSSAKADEVVFGSPVDSWGTITGVAYNGNVIWTDGKHEVVYHAPEGLTSKSDKLVDLGYVNGAKYTAVIFDTTEKIYYRTRFQGRLIFDDDYSAFLDCEEGQISVDTRENDVLPCKRIPGELPECLVIEFSNGDDGLFVMPRMSQVDVR